MQYIGSVLVFIATMFVKLHGDLPLHDENSHGLNSTTLWELLKFQTNPYLQELHGHWSFNDTTDISKYEDFDHTRFQGSRELSMEELLEKMKEARRRRPGPSRSTQPPEEVAAIDSSLVTNVTVQLGGTAFLHCTVAGLNSRAVSWVRKRDWHILTSAMFTYTNDERFQVLHSEGSDLWTLQIKYVQKRDDGAYECQVAMGRGSVSHYFNLQVVAPTAHILGTGEIHIGHGSAISLFCVIENVQSQVAMGPSIGLKMMPSRALTEDNDDGLHRKSTSPPQFVMWYHNEEMINHGEGDRETRIVTETAGGKTHSRLLIARASPRHSGNYSCRASNTQPDWAYVFVSNDGDNIAAIQRQVASAGMKPCFILFLLSTLGMLFT